MKLVFRSILLCVFSFFSLTLSNQVSASSRAACSDFSGEWVGSCVNGENAESFEIEIKLSQQGCDQIAMDRQSAHFYRIPYFKDYKFNTQHTEGSLSVGIDWADSDKETLILNLKEDQKALRSHPDSSFKQWRNAVYEYKRDGAKLFIDYHTLVSKTENGVEQTSLTLTACELDQK